MLERVKYTCPFYSIMASNGLIANRKKTALVVLNVKKEQEFSVKIGNEIIERVNSAKLLGITFQSSQKWCEHIHGSGGLLSSLNQRLFFIRRLKNVLSPKALLKISDGLFISKLRYGLQLLGRVRWQASNPTNSDLETIQKCQNKLLRALNGSRVSDKISTKSLLSKYNMLSVNQRNAQVKLSEMWKSTHIINYPIKTDSLQRNNDMRCTKAVSNGVLVESKTSNLSQKTFLNDAIHIWNLAPLEIKACESLFSAKKH